MKRTMFLLLVTICLMLIFIGCKDNSKTKYIENTKVEYVTSIVEHIKEVTVLIPQDTIVVKEVVTQPIEVIKEVEVAKILTSIVTVPVEVIKEVPVVSIVTSNVEIIKEVEVEKVVTSVVEKIVEVEKPCPYQIVEANLTIPDDVYDAIRSNVHSTSSYPFYSIDFENVPGFWLYISTELSVTNGMSYGFGVWFDKKIDCNTVCKCEVCGVEFNGSGHSDIRKVNVRVVDEISILDSNYALVIIGGK